MVDAVFNLFGIDNGDGKDSAAQMAARERPDASPPCVLCIEDDADFSRALKLRLEAHGVAVVRAFEGMKGYRTAFTHPADAIILDFRLPNGQGDYILRRLKDNPVTEDIPVIVLTGVKDRALERTMYNLGAADYLTKPLDFDSLLDVLSRYIDVLPKEAVVW